MVISIPIKTYFVADIRLTVLQKKSLSFLLRYQQDHEVVSVYQISFNFDSSSMAIRYPTLMNTSLWDKYRSSRSQIFFRSATLFKKTPTKVGFFCKICEIFKNIFFMQHLWWLLLQIYDSFLSKLDDFTTITPSVPENLVFSESAFWGFAVALIWHATNSSWSGIILFL